MDLKYNKDTDTEHEIKLTSYLISAAWRFGAVHAGQKAQVEVLTAFVGNGTGIKLTARSDSGKKLGKLDGKIKNNKFVGEIDIDDDAKIGDDAYFEVDISKAGVDGESNHVPILPPIEVTNMKWSEAEARRGDILTLSADVSGVASGTEVKIVIYEYDSDNIHDKITEFPATVADEKIEVKWEYEYHEDTDEIPSDDELQRYGNKYNPPEYFFVIEADGLKFGREQESKLLEFKDWIQIELQDVNGNPVPDVEYEIKMPDGSTKSGKLDSEGRVKVENIPPGQFVITYKDLYPQLDVKDAPPPEDENALRPTPEDGKVTHEEKDEAPEDAQHQDDDTDSFDERSESSSSSGFGRSEEEEPLQG